MSNDKAGAIAEAVLIRGDLSHLTPEERAKYLVAVCNSVGLNPLTKPFEYIVLNGKLTLYARKNATDQLRTIHNISVVELTESEREGVFIVTAKVANGQGRTDVAKGAVTITGLKGDALANALMKAETKAKRRATLSICGLGFLDETEIETIPGVERVERTPIATLPKARSRDIFARIEQELNDTASEIELKAWMDDVADRVKTLHEDWQDIIRLRCQERLAEFRQYAAKEAVIWDDEHKPAADPLDIPAVLDRRAKPVNGSTVEDIAGFMC